MAKLRIKVSGSLRTLLGAQDFAAIRTYPATADCHDQNMLDIIERAMRGYPWTPPRAEPHRCAPTGTQTTRPNRAGCPAAVEIPHRRPLFEQRSAELGCIPVAHMDGSPSSDTPSCAPAPSPVPQQVR